jgi:hypothetical protein
MLERMKKKIPDRNWRFLYGTIQWNYFLFFNRDKPRGDIDDDSFYLPSIPGAYSPDFVWEHPLPPPPPRESRTNVASIKKDHEEYSKYYHLIKRKMHKYTSVSSRNYLPLISFFTWQIGVNNMQYSVIG